MSTPSVLSTFLFQLLTTFPVLLVCIAGLIIAWCFRRIAPAPSMWTLAAFALTLFLWAQIVYAEITESVFRWYVTVPVLRALTYLGLLIGVYAGRAVPTSESGVPRESMWALVSAFLGMRLGWKSMFATVFTTVLILVVVGSVVITFLKTPIYQSWTVLKLSPAPDPAHVLHTLDSRSIQTEYAVLFSDVIFKEVVAEPEVQKRFHELQKFSTNEAIELLRKTVAIQAAPDANIMRICAYGDDPEACATLANAIARVYQTRCSAPSTGSPVCAEVIATAWPATKPIKPDKALELALGLWLGVWWGAIVAAAVTWFGYRRKRSPNGVQVLQPAGASPV